MSISNITAKSTSPDALSLEDLNTFKDSVGIHIDPKEADDFLVLLQNDVETIKEILSLPDYQPEPAKLPRGPISYTPKGPRNQYGAWAYRCDIKAPSADLPGLLTNGTVVIKDMVAVAGVPCLLGTDVFSDWVPRTDATIVSRIVQAGGCIKGKSVCENMCMTPASSSSATGPVDNPCADGFTTGGSSSGTGALVAAGEVEFGIGADQGGSIRIPAAHCGLVGLKPTFGLVPYTGCASGEYVLDHVGPMTRTVESNARLLQAIAGYDGIDDRSGPNCPSPASLPSYIESAKPSDLRGLRVGILKEAFEIPALHESMASAVKHAAYKFRDLGATVEEVSIPPHAYASKIAQIISRCGGANTWSGRASGRRELSLTDLTEKCVPQTAEMAAKSYFTVRNTCLVGEFAWKNYPSVYGKAINLARSLQTEYDKTLQNFDVLVLPVVNYPARRHGDLNALPLQKVEKFCKGSLSYRVCAQANKHKWDKQCTARHSTQQGIQL